MQKGRERYHAEGTKERYRAAGTGAVCADVTHVGDQQVVGPWKGLQLQLQKQKTKGWLYGYCRLWSGSESR